MGIPAGIHVPLITPFGADGTIAADALEHLAHRVLDDGAVGLVALGTTAEAATLDEAERRAVARTVRRVCREREAHFTVGAGSNDTRRTALELSGAEADAALVPVPYFTRPSEAGVVAHFEALAAESPVPLIVYNIPYRTGQTLGIETLLRLAAIPGVVGVKHAVGGIDQDTVALLGADLPGFAVLAGDDVFAPAMLALGAAGGVLASAHLATDRWVELAGTGDRALGHRLAALAAALFTEPNPTVIKAALHARGSIPDPGVRLPLLPAGRPALETALRALVAAGDTRVRTTALIGEAS
ncbi:dihydrodipicolinate synthase family protein [Streptomyces sp. H10-C2]|uniref:dihydrodipicolinate synthase family protein n=1 Tax=unclassified Streptomyces TaxID=2593676 RepID=UPI0024B88A49|nr:MULTISPECIES: dihydrodipicolinate synthase family protein [unclassified Streptomyces]MDJ0345068.1 dihydrodipicolinate synthase family protein [Streptomyces sp. PH10-H1]MDJ0373973.1 dihydrodipicolinate synthase family protein [Streptomyces sp. H10-C2]